MTSSQLLTIMIRLTKSFYVLHTVIKEMSAGINEIIKICIDQTFVNRRFYQSYHNR